jgi:pSer/pThr/pTyr-binding forkhead associated (FHA) protein
MNCRVCGSELPDGAMFCGECGSSVSANPLTRPTLRDERPSDTSIIDPLPKPAVVGPQGDQFRRRGAQYLTNPQPTIRSVPILGAAESSSVDTAGSAASQVAPAVVSFTLVFSTGERVTVMGGGLVGRRPITQPGEELDQLIAIADVGRTVSKTHLEFGIEAHQFWVCDRFSGNGTMIRPESGRPRQCEPGRRFRVDRGARVEMGDQYFTVE